MDSPEVPILNPEGCPRFGSNPQSYDTVQVGDVETRAKVYLAALIPVGIAPACTGSRMSRPWSRRYPHERLQVSATDS